MVRKRKGQKEGHTALQPQQLSQAVVTVQSVPVTMQSGLGAVNHDSHQAAVSRAIVQSSVDQPKPVSQPYTAPVMGRGQGRGFGRGMGPPQQQEKQPGPNNQQQQTGAAWGPRAQQPQAGVAWGPRTQQPQAGAAWGPRAQQPSARPAPSLKPEDVQRAGNQGSCKTTAWGGARPKTTPTVPQASQEGAAMSLKPVEDTHPTEPPQQQQLLSPEPVHAAAAKVQLKPPARLGQGTLGSPIDLEVNHFKLTIKGSKRAVCHYDIEVAGKLPKKKARAVVVDLLNKDPRLKDFFAVFDGKKNVYTARPIEGLTAETTFEHDFADKDGAGEKVEKFRVTIKPTRSLEIDLQQLLDFCRNGCWADGTQRAVQALDIALRHGPSMSMTPVGKSLFSRLEGVQNLGGGLEVWFGHYQSLRLASEPYINIDVSQKAFVKSQKVHEWLQEFYGPRQFGDCRDFAKQIKGIKVQYMRRANGKNYPVKKTIIRLGKRPGEEKFSHNGKLVSVLEYFWSEYKVKLQFPQYPCLQVGDPSKRIMVPMEICTVLEGQVSRGKLDDKQTSAMIRAAVTSARERREKILAKVRKLKFNDDPWTQEFGLSFENQMAGVRGRVLPAPKIAYGGNKETKPVNGAWNMQNEKFVEASSMNVWGILNTSSNVSEGGIRSFAKKLQTEGTRKGMRIGDVLFIRNCRGTREDIEKAMKSCREAYDNLEMLVVIIRKKGDPNYVIVKQLGDCKLRTRTQCVQEANVTRLSDSTISNICLKLNAKLGGVNNLISVADRPKVLLEEQVMIVGADVTHPSPEQRGENRPSIAAVVGSVDPRAFQYAAEIRCQRSGQEYIQDLTDMMYNLLLKFHRIAGKTSTGKPQRIIFYRDGVGEGQFQEVLEHELNAIFLACYKLDKDYKPLVTLIVVQKRHHTRLFPQRKQDECGKPGNVPPGTVVDDIIVHPRELDFFLASHLGIQGTTRPTRYHLLWNDQVVPTRGYPDPANLGHPDELQLLTYYLCHMYSRCTRSVSYPAPCYYAHLVADRGRRYYDAYKQQNQAITDAELQELINKCRDMEFLFFV